jgi:predicted NAD/FAD-binding protein
VRRNKWRTIKASGLFGNYEVIFATHSDDSLAMLDDPTNGEKHA